MAVVRHVAFAIDTIDELTCWAQDTEDFEGDTQDLLLEQTKDFFYDNPQALIDAIKITGVWYEEVDD